jgi:hypothetical protein
MTAKLEANARQFYAHAQSLKQFMYENRSKWPLQIELIAAAKSGNHVSEIIFNEVEPYVEGLFQRNNQMIEYMVAGLAEVEELNWRQEWAKRTEGHYPPGGHMNREVEIKGRVETLEQFRELFNGHKMNWDLVKTKIAMQKEAWKAEWAMAKAKRVKLNIPKSRL